MRRSLFGLRPGRGGRPAPLDPPGEYVTVREQTIVRIGIVCVLIGFGFGTLLFFMLVGSSC